MNANYFAKAGLIVSLPCLLGFSLSLAQSADAGGHTNRGVEYARAKQYDKAIEEFSKAIEAEPKDPKNYVNRAQVYQVTGKAKEAIADYARVIELEPKNKDAYANKGSLEVQSNQNDAAIK